MSLMQEFESIRREMGEDKYNRIDRFLHDHPEYDLGDVYYRKEVYEIFEKEEPRYMSETYAQRIEAIIEANKEYRFNAAATELEARQIMFNGRELSINEVFRGYTTDELQDAVDLMAARAAGKKEEGQKMLFKEQIIIREWRPQLGARYIFDDGRVVELDALPTSIDWNQIPLPEIPHTKPDSPGDRHDRHITVRYFDVNDDMAKAEPLAKFEIWEKDLPQKVTSPEVQKEPDKLVNICTGEIYGSIIASHRMTIEDAIKIMGGEENPYIDIDQNQGDYTLNGKELWVAEIDIVSAEDARVLDTIAQHFNDMPEIWASDKQQIARHFKYKMMVDERAFSDLPKTTRLRADEAIKETYQAFQNAKHEGNILSREDAARWIETWFNGYSDRCEHMDCKNSREDKANGAASIAIQPTRSEEAIRSALKELGDLLYLKDANGNVMWPIEALNRFNTKELDTCKRILFQDPLLTQAQTRNGGRGR